jgi:hypothetical protein
MSELFLLLRAWTSDEYWDEEPTVAVVQIYDKLKQNLSLWADYLREGIQRFGDDISNVKFECSADWYWGLNELDPSLINNPQYALVSNPVPQELESLQAKAGCPGWVVLVSTSDGIEVCFRNFGKYNGAEFYTVRVPISVILDASPEQAMIASYGLPEPEEEQE